MERISDAARFENELLKQKRVDQGIPQNQEGGISVEEEEGGGGGGGNSNGNSIFPIIPTEGEIMALIDLVSEGKVRSSKRILIPSFVAELISRGPFFVQVDLSIDTSTLSEKTTRFDDFGTRQASTVVQYSSPFRKSDADTT
jgi:hypothetical protein